LIIGGIIAGFVAVPLRSPSQISVMNTTGFPMVSVTQNPLAGLGSVITVVIFFVYFWLLEGTYGQTVGKMAVKIKVLREDGSKIDYADSAVRNILRPIDLIPYIIPYLLGAILIWSSDKRQRLGDRVAHTIVVKA
ncbi:MAG: RDD family protein, partial [Halobacteriota archaeon]